MDYVQVNLWVPHLNWDAMLNMTKVELKLTPVPEMFVFFEKGVEAGVSYISNRYSKAKNKCLKSCDRKQEPKHILKHK